MAETVTVVSWSLAVVVTVGIVVWIIRTTNR